MKNHMRMNAVLVDFNPEKDWFFSHGLSRLANTEYSVYKYDRRNRGGRKLGYFTFPWRIFIRRKQFDTIIAWQQFYGLVFAFYCRLFHVRKVNTLIVLTFIYLPKRGVVGKIYRAFMMYVTHSKYIDKMVVFSKGEVKHYSQLLDLPEDMFAFQEYFAKEVKTSKLAAKGNYVFSTGRSNRDYDFLVSALKDTQWKLQIACKGYVPKDSSENVSVHHNLFGHEMLDIMSKCFCVVVPLKDLNVSSGQLVLLQAMALMKPIIVTKSSGVTDYVEDGVNGILINNTKDELLTALERLHNDNDLYDSLAAKGYEDVKTKFSQDTFVQNIYKLTV